MAVRTRSGAKPYGVAVELAVDQAPGIGTRVWVAVTEHALPAEQALAWAPLPVVVVVVVVSTPHRAEAFDAADYCIDTLRRSVPIWKRETWSGGSDWSACTHEIEDVDR